MKKKELDSTKIEEPDSTKKEWLDNKWIDAAPLIIFIIFIIFFQLCQQTLTDYPAHLLQLDTCSIQTVTSKYSGRLVWTFLLGINAFFAVVALLVYFLLIYKSRNSLKYLIICASISAFFALITLISGLPVIEPVINSTFGKFSGDLIHSEIFGELNQYKTVLYANNAINFLANMVVVATAITIYVILSCKAVVKSTRIAGSENKPVENSENNLKKLLDQVEDLRVVLYIATILLVIGVLRAAAVLNWSLKFLSSENTKEISDFFAMFTLTAGSSYTILLASMYIPAYYILRKRASEFVDDTKYTKDKLEADFNLEFFGFSIKDSLPRILAIIAPLLTGAIANHFVKILPSQ